MVTYFQAVLPDGYGEKVKELKKKFKLTANELLVKLVDAAVNAEEKVDAAVEKQVESPDAVIPPQE